MRILGLSAYYHDAAACLLVDGRLEAAAQEERFTRRKHDSAYPQHAIDYCLREGGIRPRDIDQVVFYDKPFLKFDRLLETYLAFAPRGFRSFAASLPVWTRDKLFQKSVIVKALRAHLGKDTNWSARLLFNEHHLSHAGSAFYPSPFDEAAVLTMDGVGEWTTTSLAVGSGHSLAVHREIHFPHSIGLLYSAFTYYTGFKVNSGEYKVMGLAPYGVPRYEGLIREHLVDIRDDGSFWLDMQYFDYCTGLRMTNARFDALFGGPPRRPEAPLTQRDMDLAASVQAVVEDIVVRLARGVRRETGQRNLCLAGGVALNCVANGRLARERIFDAIWVQPAAGDAGGAIGAAFCAYHLLNGRPRAPRLAGESDGMRGSFLGPGYAQADIEQRLAAAGARYRTLDDDALIDTTARALAAGQAVGWHQGRMEFGPRALGGRSILASPLSPTVQRDLNLKVKYRESFRPFAPSVLAEEVGDWFEFEGESPYMLMVAPVAAHRRRAMSEAEQQLFGIERLNVPRSEIPAVTHVDYSARIQTVDQATNPRYHQLLTRFKALTGCPVLVNTSFNVRGEPIVNTPEDAFRCLMGTGIELLVVGNCVLEKAQQDPALLRDYRDEHELD